MFVVILMAVRGARQCQRDFKQGAVGLGEAIEAGGAG